MPEGKPISLQKRSAIIALHEEGYSEIVIAEKQGVKKSTVHYTLQRYRATGSVEDRNRPGPSRITTAADDLRIRLLSKRNRRLTAPEITAEINRGRRRPVSVSTTKRRLKEANLHGRVALRKPLLRRGNRKKRLQWAQNHRNWTPNDWAKVLWSDESKYEVFGSKRRIFVRRAKHEKMLRECIVPTVKQGGSSVMVWGCFCTAGTGDLIKIDGIMRKEDYRRILENNAISSGLRLIGENFTFVHDNDPKHTARICKHYLDAQTEANRVQVMPWPPQSPDLNPLELLWDEIDRRIRNHCPTSKDHLWRLLQSEWHAISIDTLRKLTDRMPRVVQAVLNAKGGYFDEKKV